MMVGQTVSADQLVRLILHRADLAGQLLLCRLESDQYSSITEAVTTRPCATATTSGEDSHSPCSAGGPKATTAVPSACSPPVAGAARAAAFSSAVVVSRAEALTDRAPSAALAAAGANSVAGWAAEGAVFDAADSLSV